VDGLAALKQMWLPPWPAVGDGTMANYGLQLPTGGSLIDKLKLSRKKNTALLPSYPLNQYQPMDVMYLRIKKSVLTGGYNRVVFHLCRARI